MCHCDRSACTYLLLEDRDNTAVGTEDVTESCGDKLGYALYLAFSDGLVQALAIDFADSLAAAHDIGRIHGLVGGYHHEFLGSVFHSEVSYNACTVDIVLDRDCRVVFHHWHVLICCCVEYVFRFVSCENAFHVFFVGDTGDDGPVADVSEIVGHHHADIVHRGFRLVDECHFGRVEFGYLTDHFGTDGSCRSGYEDAFSCQELADGVHVHFDFLAWKKVFDVHRTEVLVCEVFFFSVPFLAVIHHHDGDSC